MQFIYYYNLQFIILYYLLYFIFKGEHNSTQDGGFLSSIGRMDCIVPMIPRKLNP